MDLPTIRIGEMQVSKLILGGNPFSGFSHQGTEQDDAMRHYYTAERIKEEYRRAEALGVNAHIGRADHHIIRVLMEYWDEGGKIQWIAQTCPELGETPNVVGQAIRAGASACYVHGGRMDWLLANDQLDEARRAIDIIHDAGLPAGIAGHNPQVFDWAAENLDVDFFMCSYYNPTDRREKAEHVHGAVEAFDATDRDAMIERIARMPKPVIHYKVFAAGRTNPEDALKFVAGHLRPQDAVCVGIYSKHSPDMLAEDVRLLTQYLD